MSQSSLRLESAAAEPTPAAARGQRTKLNRDFSLRRLLALGDLLALAAALSLSMLLADRGGVATRLLWSLLFVLPAGVVFKVYGLYDRDIKRITHSTVDDLPRVLHALLVVSLGLWFYAEAVPAGELSAREILGFALIALLLVMLTRAAVRALVIRLAPAEPALIVGTGAMASVLVTKLRAHPEYRVRVAGVLRHNGGSAPPPPAGVEVLGSIHDLPEVALAVGATRVLVAPVGVESDDLAEILRRCRELSLKLSMVPQLSDVLGPAVEIDDVEGVTVLGVNPPWLPRSSRALKRTMDVIVSLLLLIGLSPLWLVIALAIKLESRGPVFYSQERVGRRGRCFRVFKFRTMVADADRLRAELLSQSSDPHWLKLDRDPRITRVGRLLRRLSFDELPQLYNVLRSEMSLVGPRPLLLAEDEHVQPWARGRLDLTPGITGYWQVLGRTRIPFEEMVKLDYLYVMNWSLWGDLRLIIRTLPAVLGGRGAN